MQFNHAVSLLIPFFHSSFTWLSHSYATDSSHTDAPEHSYLLAITLSNDIQTFEVGHKPFLYGDDDETKDNKMALLPLKKVSSMSHKKIANMLSKAQLGGLPHFFFEKP